MHLLFVSGKGRRKRKRKSEKKRKERKRKVTRGEMGVWKVIYNYFT